MAWKQLYSSKYITGMLLVYKGRVSETQEKLV